MPIKRPGCISDDEAGHYRNGSRYEYVKDVALDWARKIAWNKITWDIAKGVNGQGGGYQIRTNVMNSIREFMGDSNPFPDSEWRQAMLVNIPPGRSLIIHNDECFERSAFDRYHIPITTNDGCKCYLHVKGTDPEEFEGFHCEVGQIYKMDPTILHYSENLGDTDRIHLVIDLKVNLNG